MAYLIVVTPLRALFFRGLTSELKQIDRNLYSGVTKLYLKNSAAGWSLFSLSFLILITVWISWKGELTARLPLFLLGSLLPLLFLFSIILHQNAFSKALLTVLRQKMGVEREF